MGIFELVQSCDLASLDFKDGNFQTPELLSKLKRESLCYGLMTHVCVDPVTHVPVKAIEGNMRRGCERILTKD